MTPAFLRRTRLFLCAVAAVATALFCAFIAPAAAEKRVALVVGNAAYQHIPRLDNPANDARLMAQTLRALGFALVGGGPQLDLDDAGFRRAVQSFGKDSTGADIALFFYAGHGLQVRGSNYLAPVGANPVREADVDFHMLDSNVVLRQMESAGARLNIVILDACRNNPFSVAGLRSTGTGLAQMQAPQGTLISFATQPGNVALDGTGNSPYTKALTDVMRRPGLDIFRTFNEVGLAVSAATGGAQQPWVSLSPIKGDFFFAGQTAALTGACAGKCVDTGIAWPGKGSYLFMRDKYARFTGDTHDAGYPRPIAGNWPDFPAVWGLGVDAAMLWDNGRVYIFRGDRYQRYDIAADGDSKAHPPRPIAEHWEFPKGWETRIDGAVNWGDGKIYVFRGAEYLRYDIAGEKVDAGYPKPIAGNWSGFPPSWSSGIDAAMNWGNGHIYIFKGDQYLRYELKRGGAFDAFGPFPVAGNWSVFAASPR
jgi:hypothetical protein